jgi:hypothetical protein
LKTTNSVAFEKKNQKANEIDDEGMRIISDALKNNTSLSHLNLSGKITFSPFFPFSHEGHHSFSRKSIWH